MTTLDRATFRRLASQGNAIPLVRQLMSDQVTPVLAYRRLVSPDEREAPSFLLESVEGGRAIGRYSFVGAQPSLEVLAREHEVVVTDHAAPGGPSRRVMQDVADPLSVVRDLTRDLRAVPLPVGRGLAWPEFTGGWVGYAGYDVVRYLEPEKLPFAAAPKDDRGLPDLHFAFYPEVAVFDHVRKVLSAVHYVRLEAHESVDAAYDAGCAALDDFVDRLEQVPSPLAVGTVDVDPAGASAEQLAHGFTQWQFEAAVERTREYIAAGDAFQVVLSQRFERETTADPFDVYRALRIVNPSPYMIYLQAPGAILVASSPEILCRCHDSVVTNRPLAGTRRRGATAEEDAELERDLRADAKERAEHVMLVDLGRNDVGRVCTLSSINLPALFEVERYSHVMHLSSTVTGRLREGLDAWDALTATLPVGTVSGAPKVRAMQIIDELEPCRRGPYAGGIGYVGVNGEMDMAIALRTIVVPTARRRGETWTLHLQAGAGIVADSVPALEYEETVNKASALNAAIDVAERAFLRRG